MIKLKAPLNYKGLFHPVGSIMPVEPDLAARMVKAGTAEYYNPAKPEQEPAQNPSADQKPGTDQNPSPSSNPDTSLDQNQNSGLDTSPKQSCPNKKGDK